MRIKDLSGDNVSKTELIVMALLAAVSGYFLILFEREHETLSRSALASFRSERHADSLAVRVQIETRFRQIYQGIRTIARLPGVREIAMFPPYFSDDARISAQEIYNNLAENVSVSELYIVPTELDPDGTSGDARAPREPILTFDSLIVGRNADQHKISAGKGSRSQKLEEIEIFEYREMKRQIDVFKSLHPTESTIQALAYPALSSTEVITCDNTRYSPSAPNDADRMGLVYSVPFYDQAGALRGIVSAVILSAVLTEQLPNGLHAIHNGKHGYLTGSKESNFWRSHTDAILSDATVSTIPYTEIQPLNFPDLIGSWVLWSGAPDAMLNELPELKVGAERLWMRRLTLVLGATLLAFAFRWQSRQNWASMRRNVELEEKIEDRTSALAAAKREAEEANSAKSMLLARVSHEIRTPMHAIMCAADILAMSKLDVLVEKKIGIIKNASHALLDLVNQVLDFSEIEQGKIQLDLEKVHVPHLVANTCEMLRPWAESKGLELKFDVDKDAPEHIVADPGRIRQVLVNLAGNAIKYTQSGHIAVRATPAMTRHGERHLRFDVIDTGPGIAEAERRRLFEPFGRHLSRFRSKTEGAGLGLSICRHLVELMGGTLGVESMPESGSRFHFTVPIGDSTAAERQTSEASSEPIVIPIDASTRGARVLLAEDNVVMQQLTRELLEKLGCEVEVVDNGADAVKRVAQSDFDIVLMDYNMPDINGVEAAREIRDREASAHMRELPIIALTANAFKNHRDECLGAGMNDFLSKPFSQVELWTVLKRNLEMVHSVGPQEAQSGGL